jgi:hypothetical protein
MRLKSSKSHKKPFRQIPRLPLPKLLSPQNGPRAAQALNALRKISEIKLSTESQKAVDVFVREFNRFRFDRLKKRSKIVTRNTFAQTQSL